MPGVLTRLTVTQAWGKTSSYKDPGHTGLGLTLVTSFYLNPLFKGPAANSHIVWGARGRLHHVNRGTAFKPSMTAQHSCVHAHLHTGRGEGPPAPSATPVTRKSTVGALTRAGLLEGCRPLEEIRRWSGAQPLGQPPTSAHPPIRAQPQEEGTTE